jgi:GMP synthase (glutamine-hydrolysing)
MFERIRYLLLQVRNDDDPMRQQELACFARALDTNVEKIGVFHLMDDSLEARHFRDVDILLLGGSGDYSAAGEGEWLWRALDSLRLVHGAAKPTFASCWGFQAMARALGGQVVNDPAHAELGTHRLRLTHAGRNDPVFAPLGETFLGHMGHEDCVIELPPQATLLASSDRVVNQAYRLEDAPIYCTQFHPELNCNDLMQRVRQYPHYVERIAGLPPERFGEMIEEAPETEALLKRFVTLVLS